MTVPSTPTMPSLGTPPSVSLLDISPVIPVVVLNHPDEAVPLSRALIDGGIGTIEVTLRSEAALPGIERIAAEVPEMLVGAGTILNPADVRNAVNAGSQFLVSPGSTSRLLAAMSDSGVPHLPGVSTLSEMMTLLDRGITEMKFFPAKAAGGHAYLSSVAGPLPQVRFCPTGGITPLTARDYLALPNVGCVGGTWLAPKNAVANGDWARITELAAQASSMAG
ncbi:bifunctional 4-hydroxy-2-oxoglutarate aldolase/2-dehydro-3-deoxy-phosphogluconate aldolase [Hoyosella altamirensis]|uniref:2-dehydro-3-deoxy-phosphogluconate aldolase n=1 Tax=Hoyosella altamirensis TaxID=616997 RepID=A0A839RHR2_9ACTN|nr:bifunctional 4-hydroxy-2-oxoglutarate aldolase/2-dehydro-3-deoxy-phosphogluconate aldolase [Hoyosella altamirensis]MBB3035744.1 2-dehydro-3-deoxyphosphogluconate aldolase/(4S)-4-hydroxy-2-oxoglutarate aldolase [Hoyosella altamirensis]